MDREEGPEDKIVRLMAQTAPSSTTPKASGGSVEAGSNVVSINGNSNIVSGGDLHVNVGPARRPKVHVQTGVGTIDARQKAELTAKLHRFVKANNAVRNSKMTYQAAWSALNRSMGVNSYHELRPDQFKAALKWIRTHTGRVQSMSSAPAMDPNFRVDTIRFIKARSKELGDPNIYRPYALKTFGHESLADLGDRQLQVIRKWLANKRI